ncbi:MAG TPA: autorepressor SdpR family transcription factor [Treponemataceae bacterium]|jgi:DNA-binding transcriptional ArsR family regulator|nr:MAG: Transcriptional repressor SdpR [Spirochaetes bacterium ADurb.Bin215]HOS36546.1 autorepressor SdpR family transcription factor [Treponemataceae bacterium]HPA10999.1 autorepressor SdpR family transcription factor [Treponemataceae bacterium]
MNDLFKALSDKTRRDILDLLKTRDMSAGEIASAFPISAASISHHLNILKQADLVASVRDGQSIIYSLNTSVFQDLVSWVYTLQGKD